MTGVVGEPLAGSHILKGQEKESYERGGTCVSQLLQLPCSRPWAEHPQTPPPNLSAGA